MNSFKALFGMIAIAALELAHATSSAPPTATFEYSWSAGAAAAGDDVAPALECTLQSAEQRCTALPRCRGFTYLGGNGSSGKQLTYFKSSPSANTVRFPQPRILVFVMGCFMGFGSI